jgi:hypothetical protein
LFYFEHHLRRSSEEEDLEIPDSVLIELVLRDIGLEYIPKCTICMKTFYMRRGGGPWIYMGLHASVKQSAERLNNLNRYLLHFPEEHPK